MWLEEHLANYAKCLLVVSHSQVRMRSARRARHGALGTARSASEGDTSAFGYKGIWACEGMLGLCLRAHLGVRPWSARKAHVWLWLCAPAGPPAPNTTPPPTKIHAPNTTHVPNTTPYPITTPSQDFLNAVCTHTMWLANGTIKYYGGNYAKFVATVEEEERLQLRVYEKQQADMDKLEKFVEVNRANGVANSAKSKKKVLGKLQDEAVERPLIREPSLVFSVSASECPLIAFLIKAQHECL